jgi:hypothetical protein
VHGYEKRSDAAKIVRIDQTGLPDNTYLRQETNGGRKVFENLRKVSYAVERNRT